MDLKLSSSGVLSTLRKLQPARLNPSALIIAGILLLLFLVLLLFFSAGTHQDGNDGVLKQAQKSLRQVSASVREFSRVLQEKHVQQLAIETLSDPDQLSALRSYVSGRLPQLIELKVYGPDLQALRAREMGPFGYALLDMLLTARKTGKVSAQVHGTRQDAYLALATRIGAADKPTAYLLTRFKPDTFFAALGASFHNPGSFALDQYNGRFPPTPLITLAQPRTAAEYMVWMRVAGTHFRVGVVLSRSTSTVGGFSRILLFASGLFLLGMGIMLKFQPLAAFIKARLDPPQNEPAQQGPDTSDAGFGDSDQPGDAEQPGEHAASNRSGRLLAEGLGKVELPDLSYKLEKRDKQRNKIAVPVELSKAIFRAYDIRGVVGKTLDAEIARQVGQVVGSLTLEQDAGPVVVARDGRQSGADLVNGMIEGITNAGCDIINIGAVPTGVLYFSAYELGKGSGVMVTGSHNPPDYNGFKILIGGVTQAGEQISDMYARIQSGNLRVGRGTINQESMLQRYREKISADIQLKKPLKIVADCGNGIGGVCAADVLRSIGATVIPLYDEVDGNFPNHHPDPSEPENLKDLLEAVALMEADLGVAFDGDADRLGVVTPDGQIIYSDRLMMLFAKDVLSREPGATVIYDVKCTNHLAEVIEAAGGVAMMYKTGHSLIKNKMKEVGVPFAGEMSGHFFFKERWYGFDCGIYAAARLLEILAADERSPQAVLNALPNSVSTPELKVQMTEGANHAFVAQMQEKAKFEDAIVNTIDGVRADFVDGWGLVRASNTTPVLVLRFDADDKAALQRIKHMFKQQILAINGGLKLPF